ncbi:MAG: radical SAM/SPASM domain-containing protein [Planctomycetota bacterium]|jgi:radical SAM protein with 4Fe4S-binding SPASM domain
MLLFTAKKLLPKPLKKKLTFHLSPFFARKRIRQWNGLPDIVLIENTNHCNAKCIMCPHVNMKREKGIMSSGLYNHIIDECVTFGIERIQVTGTGEPLLDQSIFDKIRYAKNAGIKEINIFSNGSLLDKQKQEELLTSGVDVIYISIDGFTKEVYEKIRIGLPFEKVKDNVLGLLHTRKSKALRPPYVVIAGLGLTDEILLTVKSDFYEEVKELSDRVTITELNNTHSWAGSIESQNCRPFAKRNQPCRRLWASLSVLWDGQVSLCCIDYEGKINLGNITKQSIKDLYNNPIFKKLRNHHVNKEFNKIPLCKDCEERPSWVNKRSERILDILKH